MKDRVKIILITIGFGLFYACYDFYDYWVSEFPRLQQAQNQMEQKIAALEKDSQRLQNFAKNIDTIKQEFRELNSQLETVLEHMPRTFNLASLLRKLTMLAQNSGIDILVFKPKKETLKTEGKKEAAQALFYETISVEFSLKGPFTQTLVFFDQLARLKRIVNVDSLKISTQKESGKTPIGSTVVASTDVIIRTYRFNE